MDPRLSPRHDRALGAHWATDWLPTIHGLAEEDGPHTPEAVLEPYSSEDPFNMTAVERLDHPACPKGHTYVHLTFTAKHPYNVRLDKVQFIPGDDFSPVGAFPRDGWLPMAGGVAEVSGCTQFGFSWSVLAAQGPWLYPPVGHSAGHFVP
ncbi:MAG: hypothetical protein KY455_06765 [Euryarchaeota archaeon]|nr:hypothetical protein [Euryarchaeota archaeon]